MFTICPHSATLRQLICLLLLITEHRYVDPVYPAKAQSGANQRGTRDVKNSEPELDDDGFTKRVLVSWVIDISLLKETVERIEVKVHAMAKEHGVDIEQINHSK